MRSAPWLFALALMWFGWGASTTMLGIVALVLGTTWVLALFATERTPRTLDWFTATWTLGWLPALVWEPWLIAVPVALVVARFAWRRRQQRWKARLREFQERERHRA
ncbi:MAG: hypothetical protein M0R73_09005 [Dehalococcoidia bacterium]|nr:hypothetical protein [Dehalococcoidia bacterium]